MKRTNQYIIKRPYHKPAIEEVVIDMSISLNSPTDGEGEFDPLSTTSSEETSKNQPDYGSHQYREASNPFGGDRPQY
ncbi:hypothetical protein [Alkalitalea saponilacus]|uniref:Uncharacterized protein n=1 Tax=Alkalitalea saponilacus TaxID=889453 RepID=A0A1T5HTM6_9BACT|nr:hypothetical protein [Alkalitalea saponilacus]ASB49945.1 hypothetical protein CDL62_12750 [Alkalitalea saponilacus]SKC24014.1 hypothetical protein SAMN03080601_03304 [Alkalitalea saponilacus]